MANPLYDNMMQFIGLPSAERDEIVETVLKQNPEISVLSLANTAKKNFPTIKRDIPWLESFLTEISNLIAIAAGPPIVAENFALFLAGWSVDPAEGKSPPPPDLVSQLEKLLKCENPLGVTAKAQNIVWGHGKCYSNSHVITQIRPLFYLDVNSKPDNAVVVHELRLEFRENAILGAICVNMDTAAVRSLIVTLNRALSKEQTLKKSQNFNILTQISE